MHILATHLALVGIVGLDVPDVMLGEVVDGGLDGLHAAWLPHGLGGEVGVGPGSVPVSLCLGFLVTNRM